MSKELIEFFQQYGNVVVFLIAGGTVVAAVIGAVNAIVVALISARAAQQLALTNDHRKYRSTLTKEIITDVEKLFGQLRGIISARKEPGGEADYMVKLRGELVKRREAAVIYPTTGDELFDRASDLAHSIEDHARGVLIERRENAYEQLFILGRLLKRLR